MDVLLGLLAIVVVVVIVFVVMEKLRKRWGFYQDGLTPQLPRDSGEPPAEPNTSFAEVPDRIPVVGATDWGGVFLETAPGKTILCVLPQLDAEGVKRIPEAREAASVVEAVVVVNAADLGGYLWGSEVMQRLGLGSTPLYATDPQHPIDRTPQAVGAAARKGDQLPKKLRRGEVTLRRRGQGVLEVRWSFPEGRVRGLVGAGIPFGAFKTRPHPNHIVGSIAWSDDAAGGAPDVDAILALRSMTLLRSVPPDSADAMAQLWPSLGVQVTVVGPAAQAPAWVDDAVKLVQALQADDAGALRELLEAMDLHTVELALIGLAARGEIDHALALSELALQIHGEQGTLWFQRGVASFMAGKVEAAERAYRKVAQADEHYAMAQCNLSAVLMERGDGPGALRAADRALQALPDDPLSLKAALIARVHARDWSGARTLLADRGGLLEQMERGAIERALEREAPDLWSEGVDHVYPLHARLMLDLGHQLRSEDRPEDAVDALRRAVELQPGNLEANADLAGVLSDLGRDKGAIAVYDAAIERVLGGELLRFNRGNARRRLERLEEAVADYEACCELSDSWVDPRVNLISTLQQLGRVDEARERLRELEQLEVDAELLAALREQLERA